jgi:plasmid stabilization system protein ParE
MTRSRTYTENLTLPVGKLPNTHEIRASTNYRMVYQVAEDTVWILAIVHTARRWPPFRE